MDPIDADADDIDNADYVLPLFAWVGLRRWLYGRTDGEQAWDWLLTRIDALRPDRPITAELQALEAALRLQISAK